MIWDRWGIELRGKARIVWRSVRVHRFRRRDRHRCNQTNVWGWRGLVFSLWDVRDVRDCKI